MAIARFLQITFEFEGQPKIAEVRPEFDKALDWIRIAPNAWILWTTSTPQEWYARLKPRLGLNDHIYIFGIDNNVRYGWAQKNVWEWLDKAR